MGCTEPIAIAYAAAKARELLGRMPDKIVARCSGNIIKNVKGVDVPNAGGQKGVEVAALLGALAGDPEKELEVISSVPEDAAGEVRRLHAAGEHHGGSDAEGHGQRVSHNSPGIERIDAAAEKYAEEHNQYDPVDQASVISGFLFRINCLHRSFSCSGA
jgi:hypothetical protein